MSLALLVFVSAFFSTADGLEECTSIPSFFSQSTAATTQARLFLEDQVRGQCQPSKHPGAFYTEKITTASGEQLTDDKDWECWDPAIAEAMAKGSDQDLQAMAESKGFAGACTFAAYESTTTPEEVPLCSKFLDHNPTECNPGPEKYWGACVTDIPGKWKCIPKEETELVAGFAKGDCKHISVPDTHLRPFHEHVRYNDVCRFEIDKPFKCPTVPTYIPKDASTCSGVSENGDEVHDFHSACFSIAERTRWSCRAEAAQESSSCTWTPLQGKIAWLKKLVGRASFYDGLCLLPGNPSYDKAADWPTQPEPAPAALVPPAPPAPPAPEAATTTNTTAMAPPSASLASPALPPKEQEGGIGGGWKVVLVLLMLGCCCCGCYIMRSGLMLLLDSARELPLLATVGAGSEMSARKAAAAESGSYLAD